MEKGRCLYGQFDRFPANSTPRPSGSRGGAVCWLMRKTVVCVGRTAAQPHQPWRISSCGTIRSLCIWSRSGSSHACRQRCSPVRSIPHPCSGLRTALPYSGCSCLHDICPCSVPPFRGRVKNVQLADIAWKTRIRAFAGSLLSCPSVRRFIPASPAAPVFPAPPADSARRQHTESIAKNHPSRRFV